MVSSSPGLKPSADSFPSQAAASIPFEERENIKSTSLLVFLNTEQKVSHRTF